MIILTVYDISQVFQAKWWPSSLALTFLWAPYLKCQWKAIKYKRFYLTTTEQTSYGHETAVGQPRNLWTSENGKLCIKMGVITKQSMPYFFFQTHQINAHSLHFNYTKIVWFKIHSGEYFVFCIYYSVKLYNPHTEQKSLYYTSASFYN